MDRKGSHQGRQRVGGLLGLLRLGSPPLSLGNYIFLTGHPKMVGGGGRFWREPRGREWKMSLGVGRLLPASILALNVTIWPQLQGATSSRKSGYLSEPSQSPGSKVTAFQTLAALLSPGRSVCASLPRPSIWECTWRWTPRVLFLERVRGRALWAWRGRWLTARNLAEPRHREGDWGGR